MSRTQLGKATGIITNARVHFGKNEDVRVDVLVNICGVLKCNIEDIMDIIPMEESVK